MSQVDTTASVGGVMAQFSRDVDYTQNEWKCKLHWKRVKMKTTLDTSEENLEIDC